MKVYIIAGEPSGDILASSLMRAMHIKYGDVEFMGVGGESMTALGFRSLFDISEISVMGIFEVIPRLPLIMRRLREVVADIKNSKPDVIVTVDSWGFVSNLLGRLKNHGIKIPKVHYVAPQVWAWKKGRAKNVGKITDRLMTLLPYEPQYFEKYGLKCDFVGHPVVENTAIQGRGREQFMRDYNIADNSFVLTILPGSRRSEISRLIPVFKVVIQELYTYYPNLFLIIPTVATVEDAVRRSFSDIGVPFRVVTGQQTRYDAFRASAFAIAASGTVSLELTACGTPHVIAYKFNALTNILAKRFVNTKFANLLNILSDREIIPEFVLDNCKPDLILDKTLRLLQNPLELEQQQKDAIQALSMLRLPDKLPSERAAEIVAEMAGIDFVKLN